ncbi:MAG TPA: nitrilase-related carbon-nitrogen hydrolase [Desulfobacterales bacterium]|nr:nitrilase-related carbon-nitrogen hydrolase [Desulfobacterales bacterium]
MISVRIAAVVFNSPRGETRANLDRMEGWVAGARAHGAGIVCFPELNITGYGTDAGVKEAAEPVPGPLTERLGAMAARHGLVILAGLAEQADDGRIWASHLAVAPAGLLGWYRKLHIAPPEQPVYSAGDRVPIFEACGIRFGIQLCYDAHFPELSARMAIEGADVIFMPHASPRGTPDDKRSSWMRHLPARAFDNGVFIVACNQTGDNGRGLSFPGVATVIGPNGRVLAESTTGAEGVLITDLKAEDLAAVRRHPMRYFLPHRRPDLY